MRDLAAVPLERRDPDVWRPLDFRDLRVVVEEPFDLLLVELLLLALLLEDRLV